MQSHTQFETVYKILHLGKAVQYYRNQILDVMELTPPQNDALMYILKNYKDSEITASGVMEELQLSQSTVAGILKRLEKKELIIRQTDNKDTRKSLITPSEKAVGLDNMLRKTAMETEHILTENMSDEDIKTFNRLLQMALESMNDARKTSKTESVAADE